jgi:hypothetical protein
MHSEPMPERGCIAGSLQALDSHEYQHNRLNLCHIRYGSSKHIYNRVDGYKKPPLPEKKLNSFENPPCGICLTQCEIVRAFGGHAICCFAYTKTLFLLGTPPNQTISARGGLFSRFRSSSSDRIRQLKNFLHKTERSQPVGATTLAPIHPPSPGKKHQYSTLMRPAQQHHRPP